jgi:hypothetical protein
MPFNPPTDADLDDLGRTWLDQLSGRRNFETSLFMGFTNDLLLFERKDWRGLFRCRFRRDGVEQVAERRSCETHLA